MAFNMKELADFLLPLVEDGKEEEAGRLLAQASHEQPFLPSLLGLVKPEHAASVADYLAKSGDGGMRPPEPRHRAAGASAQPGAAKKPFAPAKPGFAPNSGATLKKPAAGGIKKTGPAQVKRPAIHRPANP